MTTRREDRAPIEKSDRWQLRVGDGAVTQLQIDFSFGFAIEMWLYLRIQTPFMYYDGDTSAEIEPEDSLSIAPLLDIRRATVTLAEVYKDGRLRVEFANGNTIAVTPDAQYEAFWVSGDDFRLIALPDGGLHTEGI
jgi:hypothetical protein